MQSTVAYGTGKDDSMKKEIVTAEQFLKDVKNHQMEVLQDVGLYRHLRFRALKDSFNQWFEVVTWPESLAINGDMGSWSFAGVDDMFTFFRGTDLRINPSYWAEKITSESKFGGPHEKFHVETFKENVLSSMDGYGLSNQKRREIVKALKSEVFVEEDEWSVRRAISEFKCGDFIFTDSWEISGNRYTHHFIWCLYAIVWAISQYDSRVEELERMAQ
jgi:hypothetical protein